MRFPYAAMACLIASGSTSGLLGAPCDPGGGGGSGKAPRFPMMERGEEEALFLLLKVEGRDLDTIQVYRAGGTFLVPLRALADAFGYALDVDPRRGLVTGFLGREDFGFRVDLKEGAVQFGLRSESLAPGDVERHPMDLFVPVERLARWWPVDLEVDAPGSVLKVRPREPLPYQARAQRSRRGATLGRSGFGDEGWRTWKEAGQPRQWLNFPAADLNLRSEWGRDRRALAGQLAFSGEFLKMDASGFLSGGSGRFLSQGRLSLGRRFPEDGPLGLQEIQLGYVNTPSLDLVGGGISGYGVYLSNAADLFQGAAGQNQTFRGALPPGWQAELYHNGQLHGFSPGDEKGTYAFEKVPVLVGRNRYLLVLHGPQGERREEEVITYGYSQFLPAGKFQYRAGFAGDHGVPAQGSLEMAYGLGSSWMLKAGLADVDRPSLGRQRYGQVDLLTGWRGSILRAGVAHRHLNGWMGLLDGRFPLPGHAQFALNYRHFHRGFRSENQAYAFDLRESLGGSLVLPLSRFSLTLGATQEWREGGGGLLQRSLDLSTHLAGFSLSNTLTHRAYTGASGLHDYADGRFSLSKGFGFGRLGGTWNYGLNGNRKMNSYQVNGSLYLPRSLVLNATASGGAYALPTHSLQLNHATGAFSWGLGLLRQERRGFQITANLRLSLDRSPLGGGWGLGSTSPGSGSLAARVFLDTDGSGLWNPCKPPVPGARIQAGQAASAGADDQGRIHLRGLRAYHTQPLRLEEGSLPDPSWQGAEAGYRFTPRPGAIQTLDIPVKIVGEISGSLLNERGGPLAGYRMELLDGRGEKLQERWTAFDGFFTFPGVPTALPLSLRIAPASLEETGYLDPGPRALRLNPQDPYEDVTIRLVRSEPTPEPVPTPAAQETPAPPVDPMKARLRAGLEALAQDAPGSTYQVLGVFFEARYAMELVTALEASPAAPELRVLPWNPMDPSLPRPALAVVLKGGRDVLARAGKGLPGSMRKEAIGMDGKRIKKRIPSD